MKPSDLYTLTPSEFNILIENGIRKKEERLKEYLELATFCASLVMNEKAESVITKIRKSLSFSKHSIELEKTNKVVNLEEESNIIEAFKRLGLNGFWNNWGRA